MRGKSLWITIGCIAWAVFLCGCDSQHQKNKNAALARWNQTRVKLAVDLARQQYENGQFQKALLSAQEATGLDKNYGPAWLIMARVQLELGQVDDAASNLSLAQHLNPNDPENYYVRGIFNERSGENDRAIDSYRKAAELEPDYLPYTIALAQTLAAGNRLGEALDILNRPLEQGRQDTRLFYVAAQVLASLEMNERAENMYRKALLLQPDDPELIEACAYISLKNGKPQIALNYFEKLETSDSADTDALIARHLAMGECYLLLERYRLAQRQFERVRDHRPNDAAIYKRLAQTATGLKDWSRSRIWIERALQLNDTDPETYVLSAYVNIMIGAGQSAQNDLIKARSLAPRDPLVYTMICRLKLSQGSVVEARAALAQALEIDPANPIALRLSQQIEKVETAGSLPNNY